MSSIKSGVSLAFLAIMCLAGAAPAHKGYDDVLTPRFILEHEVDLTREEFSGVGAAIRAEGIPGCRAEIVRVITRLGPAGDFEPWPARVDALQRADRMLSGVFQLGVHPGYLLGEDLKWSENPSGSANWEFNLLALDALANLTEAWRQTGDRVYLDRGKALLLDFIEDNLDCQDLPSRYSWYDHSVAYRTIHAIDFWHEWTKLGESDEDFVTAFVEMIWRQAKYLEHDKYYSSKTNHGMYAAIAQLRLSLAFPWFLESDSWKEKAVGRMAAQAKGNFTPDGIHMEYSPAYHILTTKLMMRFRDDFGDEEGLDLPGELDDAIDRARASSIWLFHPDGMLSLIGDSSLGTAEELLAPLAHGDPAVEYVMTGGRKGKPPGTVSAGFTEAQLFVMRSGWGEKRPFSEESFLIADFCPYGKAHQHDDFLSFEYSSRGTRWFTDLGVFNYNRSDAGRKYVTAARAHNVIVPVMESRRVEVAGRQGGSIPEDQPAGQRSRMLDTIERIPEPSARIEALKQVLDKGAGELEPRVLLMMAITYEEMGSRKEDERECLVRILDYGGSTEYYAIAAQLLEMIEVDASDIELEEVPESVAQISKNGRDDSADMRLLEQKPAIRRSIEASASDGQDLKVTSNMRAVGPSHGQPPRVEYWISTEDYDYVEGSFDYSKQFQHGRALLFLRSGVVLLVDRISSRVGQSFRELFHLHPSVTVTGTETGYLLNAPGGAGCIFDCVTSPPGTVCSVINGQKNPELQGWFSGRFDNLEPAPVIEYSFDVDGPAVTYFVHLIVPYDQKETGRTEVSLTDSQGKRTWDPGSGEPINMMVTAEGESVSLAFTPSSSFMRSAQPYDARKPLIVVRSDRN